MKGIMKKIKSFLLATVLVIAGGVYAAALTLLVPSGPDGDGLRMLGEDYEKLTGVTVESVQVPYVNAREKVFTACSTLLQTVLLSLLEMLLLIHL